MARILDGNLYAAKIREEVTTGVAEFNRQFDISPGLAVVIVGENPASQVYVSRKHKACQECAIRSEVICLPEDTPEQELLAVVDQLNADPSTHGILVQLPLPRHINTENVLDRIRPDKDVDGFHPINVGNLSVGRDALIPCTPNGIIKMLDIAGIPIEGKRAVIIGRSNIVGKPMLQLLLARNATVTVCHSRTKNLAEVAREAEILVAAIGKPNFVTADMVQEGAVVIDVGINRVGKKLVGDVDFEAAREKASAITPVPGGVGPLTIAMLLHNTLKAAQQQLESTKMEEER
jgi:methylenetetrahydrofolate dehydrogenase (NADP+)/methenyltetrahydrofolate cyclohydrolase